MIFPDIIKMGSPIKYYCEREISKTFSEDYEMPTMWLDNGDTGDLFNNNISNNQIVKYIYNSFKVNVIFAYDMRFWDSMNYKKIKTRDDINKWPDENFKTYTICMTDLIKSYGANIEVYKLFLHKHNGFMRVIISGFDYPCEELPYFKINASIIYNINDTHPGQDLNGLKSYPIVFIGIIKEIKDKITLYSKLKDYKSMYLSIDPPPFSKYISLDCGHFIIYSALQSDCRANALPSDYIICDRCGRQNIKVMPFEILPESYIEKILTHSEHILYKKGNPSGNIDIVPIRYKFLFICSEGALHLIKKECEKLNLSLSINKMIKESESDVKIITKWCRLDSINLDIYTHITFIDKKEKQIHEILRRVLNIYRPFNVYINIL